MEFGEDYMAANNFNRVVWYISNKCQRDYAGLVDAEKEMIRITKNTPLTL